MSKSSEVTMNNCISWVARPILITGENKMNLRKYMEHRRAQRTGIVTAMMAADVIKQEVEESQVEAALDQINPDGLPEGPVLPNEGSSLQNKVVLPQKEVLSSQNKAPSPQNKGLLQHKGGPCENGSHSMNRIPLKAEAASLPQSKSTLQKTSAHGPLQHEGARAPQRELGRIIPLGENDLSSPNAAEGPSQNISTPAEGTLTEQVGTPASTAVRNVFKDMILDQKAKITGNETKRKSKTKCRMVNGGPWIRSCECKVCKLQFSTFAQLKRHMDSHSKVPKHKCKVCHRVYKHKHNLKVHMKTHDEAKVVNCPQCTFKCGSMGQLRQHLKVHENCVFECITCNKFFKSESFFKHHMKLHSNAPNLPACMVCGKRYPLPCLLKKHMESHVNEYNYACSECGKKYKQLRGLRRHEIETHSKSPKAGYKCKECGSVWATPYTYRRHKESHKKKKLHICPTCGEGFDRLPLYDVHVRFHAPMNKTFKCMICYRRFSNDNLLKDHRREHFVGSRVKCVYCLRTFADKFPMHKHVKNAHGYLLTGNGTATKGPCKRCDKLSPINMNSLACLLIHRRDREMKVVLKKLAPGTRTLKVPDYNLARRSLLTGGKKNQSGPRALAPKPLAPKPLAPKPLSPKALSPKPLSPKALAPKPLAPKALAPKPLAPKALAPKPLAPKHLAPKPLAPKPLSPKALAPKALAPSVVVFNFQPINQVLLNKDTSATVTLSNDHPSHNNNIVFTPSPTPKLIKPDPDFDDGSVAINSEKGNLPDCMADPMRVNATLANVTAAKVTAEESEYVINITPIGEIGSYDCENSVSSDSSNEDFDSKSNIDEMNSAIVEGEMNSAIVESEMNSAIVESEMNSAIVESEMNSAIVESEMNSAIVESEMNSAIVESEMNSAIVESEMNSAIFESEMNSTIVESEMNSAIVESEMNSAIFESEMNSAIVERESEIMESLLRDIFDSTSNTVGDCNVEGASETVECGNIESSEMIPEIVIASTESPANCEDTQQDDPRFVDVTHMFCERTKSEINPGNRAESKCLLYSDNKIDIDEKLSREFPFIIVRREHNYSQFSELDWLSKSPCVHGNVVLNLQTLM